MRAGVWLGYVVCAVAALSGGCYPTIRDVQEFADKERQALDAHDANVSRSLAAIKPEAAEAIAASREQFERELARLEEETRAIRGEAAQVVAGLAEVGLRLAGMPAEIRERITDALSPQIAAAQDEADAAGAVAQHATTVASSAQAEVERLAARVESLGESLREKLAGIDNEAVRLLEQARGNRAEFDRILAERAKLTEAEIAQLRGLTTEDVLALIFAAGGATLAGGALGKTGKSRAQAEIDALRIEIGAIQRRLPGAGS